MNRDLSFVWVPGEKGYKEHVDQWAISHDHLSAIKDQTNQYKETLREQTTDISHQTSHQTKELIASNNQIISALDRGFNRLSKINERGFDQVTSAVEAMHSDICYLLGNIVQKLEFQNRLLGAILTTLQNPNETEINEFYRKGCAFIDQNKPRLAEECFKESIDLKMGKYAFPSHYRLGRLYLNYFGDPKEAAKWLSRAEELIDGKEIVDLTSAPLVADCKFYLSYAYYGQLTGGQYTSERSLFENAMKYAREAVKVNPNLSHGYYHLAKYSSYAMHTYELNQSDFDYYSRSLLDNFEKAVMFDKEYLCSMKKGHPKYDGVFEPNRKIIEGRIAEMKISIGEKATRKLAEEKNKLERLKTIDVTKHFELQSKFTEVLQHVQLAERNSETGTYFGFHDCIEILNS